jgi:hypothetical protein
LAVSFERVAGAWPTERGRPIVDGCGLRNAYMNETSATGDMASVASSGQFLTFTLQNEEYGIEILKG